MTTLITPSNALALAGAASLVLGSFLLRPFLGFMVLGILLIAGAVATAPPAPATAGKDKAK